MCGDICQRPLRRVLHNRVEQNPDGNAPDHQNDQPRPDQAEADIAEHSQPATLGKVDRGRVQRDDDDEDEPGQEVEDTNGGLGVGEFL